MNAAERRYAWRIGRVPPLAGSKEAREILGIDKMTLNRWMAAGSEGVGETGAFSSNTVTLPEEVREGVYLPPWKVIASGPVWCYEDLVRHAEEFGRKRAPAGQSKKSRALTTGS